MGTLPKGTPLQLQIENKFIMSNNCLARACVMNNDRIR